MWVPEAHKIFAFADEYKPCKAHEKDALYDLKARVEFPPEISFPDGQDKIYPCIRIEPDETKLVPLGFKVACAPGFEFQVRSRSGLARDYSVFIANGPGCVDENYRGEVCALVYNGGTKSFSIKDGMRIAQGGFQKVDTTLIVFVEEDELGKTERGENGFGSTGL